MEQVESFTEDPLPIEERPIAELQPGDWFASALKDGEAKRDADRGHVHARNDLEKADRFIDQIDLFSSNRPRTFRF